MGKELKFLRHLEFAINMLRQERRDDAESPSYEAENRRIDALWLELGDRAWTDLVWGPDGLSL